MNKKCAKCSKTVYPIEEWKCLDKLWHKQCFKCQVCSMTLNMRNYKGFDKQPYCEAHIPKAKATTVAETPELKRIAENTRLQSNVKYHAEFEKTKGKLTQVADDPETLRIKQNSRIISNVAYHGDLKKKADMEQRRVLTSENHQSTGERNRVNAQLDEITTQLEKAPMIDTGYSGPAVSNSPYSGRQTSTLIYSSNKGPVNVSVGNSVGSIADLDPVNNFYGSVAANTYQQNSSARSTNSRMMPQYGRSNVYKAMYDYDAQEQDEVSFVDGDIIIDCVHIHEGWMSGVVQRTGQSGLLPANYVQSVVF